MNQQILHITAARGPAECELVVGKVVKNIFQEAKTFGFKITTLERTLGDQKNTLKSATLLLEGQGMEEFISEWIPNRKSSTVLWISQSPYRKMHRRKNWFVGLFLQTWDTQKNSIQDRNIRYETFRASGPGGQNVNKVETAVRAIHLPTGIAVTAQNARSQIQNRKDAKLKLAYVLQEHFLNSQKLKEKERWKNHTELERGNPIKTFKGTDFKANHKAKKFRQERQKHKQWNRDEV